MEIGTYIIITIYFILLITAAILVYNIYICDNGTCAPLNRTANITENKERALAILSQLGGDGIWPFAYISSSAIAAGSVWFFGANLRIFVVLLIIAFVWIYATISFYMHHYLKPIVLVVKQNLTTTNTSASTVKPVKTVKPIIVYNENI